MSIEPTRILAIRHGETAWNVDTRIQGHLDVDLNDRGRWQAQRLAQSLAQRDAIHHIYCSDLSRAHHTAQAIALATGTPITVTPGLRERHFGLFQGRTFAEIETTWPEDTRRWKQRDPDWQPEGGESLVMVKDRIEQILNELAHQHAGEQIALVAHGGVMDVLYRMATGQDLKAPRTWALSNTAVNRLLWTPQGLSLVGWADVSHLEDAVRDETTT